MTSKKPTKGAKYFRPLDTKTIRIVPKLTSSTLAKKIKNVHNISGEMLEKIEKSKISN